MQVNPKTGTKSRFVMNAMFLFWKLTEIQKHLRDCTEDIIKFANFLAERLDFVEKPVMCPWDFVGAWNEAIRFRGDELFSEWRRIDEYKDPAGIQRNIQALATLNRIDYMMPIFAEDLCGKEFAEVAMLAAKDQDGDNDSESPFDESKHCHSFPPGDPVLVEEGRRATKNSVPSEVERTPTPPDVESGTYTE